ncbi:MAG: class A beta-lactamase-related serine hydrolase [Candidatus Moranbacteria bacterium]|nr:class A beta-lactamase-related serine hydrolase [Candidatus Moranbacteria bacterium]
MRKKIIYIFLTVSLLINVFFVFKLSFKEEPAKNTTKLFKMISDNQKQFIDSNIQEGNAILHFNGLKPQLEQEINNFDAQKNIGIFLQDSRTGAWLGINEREGFNPASLLKIPIMLAVLRQIDLNELSLNTILEITPDDLDKNSGELYKKGTGYKMSVWDFIEEMILASDNTAKEVLKRQLTDAELNSVFAHVGIPNPYAQTNDSLVTPRGYTRFFKSLYFSTYLSPELSDKALEITTDTKMENLLSAGIPYEVQIAHKYGERPDGLSDCGIVYHPKSTYFICIMTRDMEVPKAKELIANLSKIIYESISQK